MKRQILSILLAILMVAAVFALSSCDGILGGETEHEHSYEIEITPPSCTSRGYNTNTCQCGDYYVDNYTNSLGHIEVVDEAIAPTCTETGLTEGKHCSVCNEVLVTQTVVDALGHTEVVDEAIAPTCTETGVTEGKHCSVCNEVLVAQTVVDALGHTEVVDEAIAPTCTETGLTEGKHCSVCNEVLVTQNTVDFYHIYSTEYTYDDTYHWNNCTLCDSSNTKSEHNLNDAGVCVECNKPITDTTGVIYDISQDGTHAVVIDYTGSSDIVKIANTYNNLPVTVICSGAFSSKPIKHIILPDSIVTIESNSFLDCTAMKSIQLGKNIQHIGSGAFENCTTLASIVLPDSITSLGASVFSNCVSLASVNIPNKITTIPNQAFYCCRSIKEIILPDSIETIGEQAFYSSSLESIKTSCNIKTIDRQAFMYCGKLKSIVIPDTVVSVGDEILYGCNSLQSITIPSPGQGCGKSYFSLYFYRSPNFGGTWGYGIPSSLNEVIVTNATKLSSYSFAGCSATTITLNEGIVSIDECAFYGCKYIKSLTIPNTVTTIGERAFKNCTALKNLILSNNLSSIGSGLVDGCNLNYNEYENCLYIGTESNDFFLLTQVSNANYSTYSINQNTKYIWSNAFANCNRLTNITIPDSVTSIGDSAFRGCSILESVVIGDSVTSIGNYAFSGCISLTELNLGNGIKTIPDYMAQGCNKLKSIFIPESVTSIGSYAFKDCSSLVSVVMPNSVTSIGSYAFSSCDSLTDVYITNLSNWCNIAFSNPSSNPLYDADNLYLNGELVTKLVIPNDVTQIKSYAFYDCDSLESVRIPDSVTSIGDFAFDSCYSLVSVVIGDSVTSIGSYAFRGCSSLVSVTIPDSVTSIGSAAFYDCDSLTEVYYNGSSAEWYRISISSYNDPLQNTTRYYYSENQPTKKGNFWHWVDGEPTVWQ